MTLKPPPDLASALIAMRQAPGRGRGRKSEIYRWMAARHDAMAAAFAKEPPSWTALAKFLADAGMRTAEDLPPTPASVRSTWIRVTQQAARRTAVAGQARQALTRDSTEGSRPPDPRDLIGNGEQAGDPDDEIPDFDKFVKDRP
jgi:hypothetical protein